MSGLTFWGGDRLRGVRRDLFGLVMGRDLPPEDSLIRRDEDTAKLRCREGVATAAVGRIATADRRKSLDAMVVNEWWLR